MLYPIHSTTAFLVLLLNVGIVRAATDEPPDPALEPCISGEVSANGLFAFERAADDLALEPAINGDVSADGRFASPSAADAFATERPTLPRDLPAVAGEISGAL